MTQDLSAQKDGFENQSSQNQNQVNPSAKDLRAKLLLILTVIGTRIPFVFNGYGNEEDSWTHVVNAFENFTTGTYQISRLPGHPLMEGLLTGLYPLHSPWLYNGLSVMAAVFSTLLVYQIHKDFKGIYPFLTAVAFAFFPTVFASSVSTIDYLFGLALVLASTRSMLQGKPVVAGVLLGLAVGFRLSYLAWGLPLLFFMPNISRQSHRGIFLFGLATLGISILCYLPAYNLHGWGFFDTYDLPLPPLPKIIYKGTVGAIGLFGMLGMLLLGINLLRKALAKTLRDDYARGLSSPILWGLGLWIAFTIALYLRIPEKSAFIIPLLPPILWLTMRGSRNAFIKWALMCFLLSPWLLGVDISDPLRGARPSPMAVHTANSGQDVFIDPVSGPIINDATKRFNKADATQKMVQWMGETQDSTLFIAGWWYPMIQVSQIEKPFATGVKVVYYATEEEIKNALSANMTIYFAPGQDEINQQKYGHDLAEKYGILLDLGP